MAVAGKISFTALLLGLVILAWIAGLDIVYALQDLKFDREHQLHSLPVALGRERSLFVSAVCYGVSLGAMVLAGLLARQKGPRR